MSTIIRAAKKDEKNTLSKFVNEAFKGTALKIVCFGDSMTFGKTPGTALKDPTSYPENLQIFLRSHYNNAGITVVNQGTSGRQTDAALLAFDADVTALAPDLVILMFGINDARDIGDSSSADVVLIDEYSRNMAAMIAKCKHHNFEVIVLSPTPTNEAASGRNKELSAYSRACVDLALAWGVPCIDLHQKFSELFSKGVLEPSVYMPDDIHFVSYEPLTAFVADRLLYSRAASLIAGETEIVAAKSTAIQSDVTNYFVAPEYPSVYFRTDFVGGTYLEFTFSVIRKNIDLYVRVLQYKYGAKAAIVVDGVSVVLDTYSPESYAYEVDLLIASNLSIGKHTISIAGASVVKFGNVGPEVDNLHIQKFVFKPRTEPGYVIFSTSEAPILGIVDLFGRVVPGVVRFESKQALLNGVVFSESPRARLEAGKALVIEVELSMGNSRNGITWFSNKAKGALNYSGVNCGYGVYVADAGEIHIFKFGQNNAFSSLVSFVIPGFSFAVDHLVRVTHTNAGVITVFVDGVQVVTATDATYRAGYFGVMSAKVNAFSVKRFDYCIR